MPNPKSPKRPQKRKVRVENFPMALNAIFDDYGVKISVPSRKLHVEASWSDVLRVCRTPERVPSYLYGDPIALLNHQLPKEKN